MSTPLAPGVLIAFEGIDGSGKTTQTTLLEAWGLGVGLEVVRTKEPTAGVWGARIRESKFKGRMSPEQELEYFLNDRREHVATVIAPALKRGALVLVDRYYYSTVAYQGARGVAPAALLVENRRFAPVPDVVFLFDIDPQVGLSRIHTRGQGQDLFENLPELTAARGIFNSLTDAHIMRLDASLSRLQLHAAVLYRLLRGPLATWARSATMTPNEQLELIIALATRVAVDPSIPLELRPQALVDLLPFLKHQT